MDAARWLCGLSSYRKGVELEDSGGDPGPLPLPCPRPRKGWGAASAIRRGAPCCRAQRLGEHRGPGRREELPGSLAAGTWGFQAGASSQLLSHVRRRHRVRVSVGRMVTDTCYEGFSLVLPVRAVGPGGDTSWRSDLSSAAYQSR